MALLIQSFLAFYYQNAYSCTFYDMRHRSRYGVNGALGMTFMNYEL